MKSIFTKFTMACMLVFAVGMSAFAFTPVTGTITDTETTLSYDDILNMSGKEFAIATGYDLTFAQKAKLKVAQHIIKKADPDFDDDDKTLVYILAIVVPPVAVAMTYDIGNEFWVNLLLTLLCWIPGVIHGYLLVDKHFKGE